MESRDARNAAPLASAERDQVRRWLERELERAVLAADRTATDVGDLLQRKGERDPCAYLSPAAAQEDTELANRSLRASAHMHRVQEIEEALRRWEEEPGRFGACDVCESTIPMERLEVIPYAQTCGSCASSREA